MVKIDESMKIIKVLCNPNRLTILLLLSEIKKDICVNEIAEKVGISQSLASHQLAYLEARGVIKSIRMGKTICYELSNLSVTKKAIEIIKLLN